MVLQACRPQRDELAAGVAGALVAGEDLGFDVEAGFAAAGEGAEEAVPLFVGGAEAEGVEVGEDGVEVFDAGALDEMWGSGSVAPRFTRSRLQPGRAATFPPNVVLRVVHVRRERSAQRSSTATTCQAS